MAIENYVGKGLVFPTQLDSTGKPMLKTGFELLNSSIKIILAWNIRHRIFLSEFGSWLEGLLEEPNDDVLQNLVEHFIMEALNKWETRINVLQVAAIRQNPTQLNIAIRYKISNSSLETTFVFPYYREIIY